MTKFTKNQTVKTIYGDVGIVCCQVGLLVTVVQVRKDGGCKHLGDFHPTKVFAV